MSNALLVIDLQNDYFPGGAYPLWEADATRTRVEAAIRAAQAKGMPVILVQHVAEGEMAPFFRKGTEGADIHPAIRALAPHAPVVVKQHADSFHGTTLAQTLEGLGVTGLLLCGMMTQNCVTHTALSKAAEAYDLTVLPDACTTVDQMLHLIALHALSTRIPLVPSTEALA